MHPYFTEALAAQRREELLRAARRHRAADRSVSNCRRRWRHLVAAFARSVLRFAAVIGRRAGRPRPTGADEAATPALVVDLTQPTEVDESPPWAVGAALSNTCSCLDTSLHDEKGIS